MHRYFVKLLLGDNMIKTLTNINSGFNVQTTCCSFVGSSKIRLPQSSNYQLGNSSLVAFIRLSWLNAVEYKEVKNSRVTIFVSLNGGTAHTYCHELGNNLSNNPTASDFYNALTSNHRIIYNATYDYTLNDSTDELFGQSIDVTNEIVSAIKAQKTYLWLAIAVIQEGASGDIFMFDPTMNQSLASLTYSSLSWCENGQLISTNAIQDYNCGSFDKGYLSLYTGKYFHTYNCYQSKSQKNPLSVVVCYNQNKKTKNSLIGDNIYFNYQYEIILDNNSGYIIEDYIGNRRFYIELDRNDSSINLYSLGIKHLETVGTLHYCYEDGSYFFLNSTTIHLYDTADNHYQFTRSSPAAQLVAFYDANGNQTVLNWIYENGVHKLLSVSNDYNDTIYFHYNSDSQIDYFYTSTETIYFSFPNNSSFKIECFQNNSSVRYFVFNYSSALLTSVYDSLTDGTLYIETTNDKTSLIRYRTNGVSYDAFSNSFSYEDETTTYYLGGDLFITYLFDNYGNIKTSYDQDGNTTSFSYSLIDESYETINQKISQNCHKNIIANHAFEIPDLTNFGWNKTGSAVLRLAKNAFSPKKCLVIETYSSSLATISQTINENLVCQDKNYQLKLFLRSTGSGATGLSIKAIKIYDKIVNGVLTHFEDDFPIDLTNLSTEWKQYASQSFSFSGQETNHQIKIEIALNAERTIYVDDVQLEDIHHDRVNLLTETNTVLSDSSIGTLTTLSTFDNGMGITSVFSQSFTPGYNNDLSTATLSKTIDISGQKGDSFLFNILTKCLFNDYQTFKGFIKISYQDNTDKTFNFDFDKHCSNWQLLTRSIKAAKKYSSIQIGIVFTNNLPFDINDIQLYKEPVKSFYSSKRKESSVSSQGDQNIVSITNSKGLLSASFSSDGSFVKYSYNSDNLVNKVIDNYHNETTFSYDLDKNITSTSVSCDYITITKNNTYSNNKLSTETDEFNNTTSYSYDNYQRVSGVTHPNNLVINNLYNDIDKITKVYSQSLENNLAYLNNKETLSTIVNIDNLSYAFIYDTYHRLIAVKLNDQFVNQFTYPSYNNITIHNRIMSKTYGSGDTFHFAYDIYDRVISISDNNFNVIYQYVYDEYGFIYQIRDLINNIDSFYFYESNGQLIKQISQNTITKNKYDNKGKLRQKIVFRDNEYQLTSYDYDYESSKNRESVYLDFARLLQADLIYFPFSTHGIYGLAPFDVDYVTNAYDSNINADVFFANKGKHKMAIDLMSANTNRLANEYNDMAFSYSDWSNAFINNKSFYLWIEPTGTFTDYVNILSIIKRGDLGYSFKLNSDGAIQISYGLNVVAVSNRTLNLNSWNFLYINFYDGGSNNKTITLNINGRNQVISVSSIYLDLDKVILADNGGIYEGEEPLPLSLAYLAFAVDNNKLDYQTLSAISSKTLSSISAYSGSNIIRSIYHIQGNKNIEYYPLDGDLESINGIGPNNFIYPEETTSLNDASIFQSVSSGGRKGYSCFKTINTDSYLSYSTSLTNSGTINLRINIPFGTITSDNGNYAISLYRNNNLFLSFCFISNKGYLYFGNSTSSTKTIVFTGKKYISITYTMSQAKVYIDGILKLTKNISNPPIGSDIPVALYVGQLGTDKTTALNGYINDLSYTSSVLTADGISNLYNSSEPIFYKEKYDKLGRLIQKSAPNSSSNLIVLDHTHTYTYNLTRISQEITYKNETYNYTYDSMGNVASISGNINRTYTYDLLNRLTSVSDNNNNVLESFSYDTNNNIVQHNINDISNPLNNQIHTFTYDNLSRLSSVDDNNNNNIVSITYNSNNLFYPSSLTLLGTNKTLTWFGNRLVSVGNDISYSYNDQGIRISKTVNNVTTYFQLEGNKITSLTKGNIHLYFRYDNNHQLIGLSDGDDEYYYIRDMLGNIHGIINSTGSYVVKYSYNAFGVPNISIQSGYQNNIVANNNPFMFKGYYYDDETGLYYCNYRYYYTLIARWISPDSFTYLNPQSLIGINLYSYCENNPIMYVDENGNFALLFTFLSIFGPSIFMNSAISMGGAAIEQIATNGWDLRDWDYQRLMSVASDYFITLEAVSVATASILMTGSIAAGLNTFVSINQAVNFIYYNNFADSKSNIGSTTYTRGYLTRWQRLDFTKTIYKGAPYAPFSVFSYGEYSGHMYWHYMSPTNENARDADVKPYCFDEDWWVNIGAIILGFLGI